MYDMPTDKLFQKAEELKPYISEEIANQLNALNHDYKEITQLVSILNKNRVEFLEPAREWVANLRELASRETSDYAELHADEVMTDVMTEEDMDRYADECIVIEGR